MVKKSRCLLLTCSALLAIVVQLFAANSTAQQPERTFLENRDRGIQLYQKGDHQGAIEALRSATSKNKDDGDAWHYLGLALLAEGKKDEARKAFETAATIRLNNLIPFPPLRALNDPRSGSEDTKRRERYQAAFESTEQYLALTPRADDEARRQLEALRFYRDYYAGTRTDETIVTTKEATIRLRILSKPPPDFSGITTSGNSVLRAVFSADGTVKRVLMLKRVAPDFDQRCIEAARKIKFTPAIKDGHAVSMILQLEYNRYSL
jgi:tetratricopeptide (TPR) repeat protein